MENALKIRWLFAEEREFLLQNSTSREICDSHLKSSEMSDVWALFDSDEPVELNSAKLCKHVSSSALLLDEDVVVASSTSRERVYARRDAGKIASEHPFFAPTRALWPAHELVDDSSNMNMRVRAFVESLTVDASERAGIIAERLRGCQPEGQVAAEALIRAQTACGARDWPLTLLSAVHCMSAHSRQLDIGDWPNYSWQLSHFFALGFYIGAKLSINMMRNGRTVIEQNTSENAINKSAIDNSRRAHIPTSEAMKKAYGKCESVGYAAAAKLSQPQGSLSDYQQLTRVVIEALNMATLVPDASMVPTWLGTGILLAEKLCVKVKSWKETLNAALKPNRNPEHCLVKPHKGLRHKSAYIVPNTLPHGSPQICPMRAVFRQPSCSLSVPDFFNLFVMRDVPVVITGQMSRAHGWAGLEQWRDLSLLVANRAMEARLVPVEFGGFGDRKGADIISLGNFVDEYLVPSNTEHTPFSGAVWNTLNSRDNAHGQHFQPCCTHVAYMSQHALFHQFPDLQKMFSIPSYTLGRLRPDTGAINVWIGTKNTITALHRDPYMNILAQTAGYKYVRLYSADQTKFLYAEPALRHGNGNTFERSLVAVEAPDFELFPLFAHAKFAETLLGPGDMLFIPKGTWHYVRSLTTSFSINFWWK